MMNTDTILPVVSSVNAFVRADVHAADHLLDYAVQQNLGSIRAAASTDVLDGAPSTANPGGVAGDVLRLLAQALRTPRRQRSAVFLLQLLLSGDEERADAAVAAASASTRFCVVSGQVVTALCRAPRRTAVLEGVLLLRALLAVAERLPDVREALFLTGGVRQRWAHGTAPSTVTEEEALLHGNTLWGCLSEVAVRSAQVAASSSSETPVDGDNGINNRQLLPTRLEVEAHAALFEAFRVGGGFVLEQLGCAAEAEQNDEDDGRDSKYSKASVIERASWRSVGTITTALERWVRLHVSAAAEEAATSSFRDPTTAKPSMSVLTESGAAAAAVLHALAQQKTEVDVLVERQRSRRGLTNASRALTARLALCLKQWGGAASAVSSGSGFDAMTAGRSVGETLIRDMVQSWSTALTGPLASTPSDQAAFVAGVVLIRDGLRLGFLGPFAASAAFHSHPALATAASELLLMRGLQYRPNGSDDTSTTTRHGGFADGQRTVQRMSATLLKALMPLSQEAARRVAHTPVGTVDSVVGLLEGGDADAAAEGTIHIVADAVLQRPHLLLPRVLALLLDTAEQGGRKSTNRRLSALRVLEHTVRHSGSALPIEVAHRLAGHLLDHLDDTVLAERVRSAAIFARLPPSTIVPRLLKAAVARDPSGRRRGAVRESIRELLGLTTDQESCRQLLFTLVDEATLCRSPSSSNNNNSSPDPRANHPVESAARKLMMATALTPGDIGPVSLGSQGHEEEAADRSAPTASVDGRVEVVVQAVEAWTAREDRPWEPLAEAVLDLLLLESKTTTTMEGVPANGGSRGDPIENEGVVARPSVSVDAQAVLLRCTARYIAPRVFPRVPSIVVARLLCALRSYEAGERSGVASQQGKEDDDAAVFRTRQQASPWVLLRTLPPQLLAAPEAVELVDAMRRSALAAASNSSATSTLNDPTIARVAWEAYARCPLRLTLPACCDILRRPGNGGGGGEGPRDVTWPGAAARMALFVACNALGAPHGPANSTAAEADIRACVHQLFRVLRGGGGAHPWPAAARLRRALADGPPLDEVARQLQHGRKVMPSDDELSQFKWRQGCLDTTCAAAWFLWKRLGTNGVPREVIHDLVAGGGEEVAASGSDNDSIEQTARAVRRVVRRLCAMVREMGSSASSDSSAVETDTIRQRLAEFVPALIADANRAAAAAKHGELVPPAAIAAECAEVIFQLVFASVPLTGAAYDQTVDFGIGCTEYTRYEAVQHEGVKLLGALFAATTPTDAAPTPTPGMGGDGAEEHPLQRLKEQQAVRMVRSLSTVANVSTNATVRRVAEQLVSTLQAVAERLS